MNVKLILILGLSILHSCRDYENHAFENLRGQLFTGTFYGSTPYTKHSPLEVTLSFESNRFIGESKNQDSPIICQGTYVLGGQEIQFKNECINEGIFKLDGTYTYNTSGDSLIIRRSENGKMEAYLLIKK